jgi:aminoacrylate hydrolase
MPHVSIGDASIYYEEQGDGPTLMLVPGLGGQGAFWGPQVRDFARDFRVIVHDHRGAGRSTHSRIQYSVDQMAADTIALMDRLGVDTPTTSATPPAAPSARRSRRISPAASGAWC